MTSNHEYPLSGSQTPVTDDELVGHAAAICLSEPIVATYPLKPFDKAHNDVTSFTFCMSPLIWTVILLRLEVSTWFRVHAQPCVEFRAALSAACRCYLTAAVLHFVCTTISCNGPACRPQMLSKIRSYHSQSQSIDVDSHIIVSS